MEDSASALAASTSTGQQDSDITSRVEDITLENKSLSNHNENQTPVSTSVTKNDSSKDGILEGEEGELDYEEDEGETLDTSDNKQDTPKKTPTKASSDIEEGELEDGEVNSDGEEGEILSDKEEDVPKKKTDKEEGEINEDDLEDGEVRDQSDPYAPNPGRGIPRKLCRYFVSGSCTWGVSCRFLHPGVNDKGAYQMLPHPGQYPVPYVRPTPQPVVPEKAKTTPALIPEYDQPEDLEVDATAAAETKPVIPEKETAWERGIRLAKENKKAAMRRKVEDKEFEQKRMMLSISVDVEEEEGNKENQIKRKDLRDRVKKDTDSSDRGRGSSGSRWRDNGERYSYKDKDKKKRNRSRRSLSSSPERSKYDRRRDNKESSRQSSDGKDLDRKRDKDRPTKPKTTDLTKKKDKDISAPVSSSKDTETKDNKAATKSPSTDSEADEGDKAKNKKNVGISNDRLASDQWHDPWQRTTSPKRRSPRRRSTSSYSSRSRSSSSSSGSSRSSRSRSRTPSSTGSESRSSSRSLSRSPSRSRSRTPSETSSRSRSRSVTPSSESDRSSTSSRASKRKDGENPSSKPSSIKNRSISRSASGSETPSDSESESDRSRSNSPTTPSAAPRKPPSLTQSPSGRGPRSPPEPVKDREMKEKKPRVEHDNRGDRGDKYRQQPMMGWDRRNQQRWEDPYGRGARGGRGNKDRESNQRRRRSRTPPARRESHQRRHFEEAAPHSQRNSMDQSRPLSPPRSSRDYNRRDEGSRSSSSNGNGNSTKSSTRTSNVPSNESWSAERRKQQPITLSSGSVRYAGHKDIKLTLNKSAGKAQPSSQSTRSFSPTRQAEASSSSTGPKDIDPKKRWGRPVEPEVPQRHTSPRDDVTSSQTTTKPIKRAADSVLTPRLVDVPSNKRPSLKPLKRPADSGPTTKPQPQPPPPPPPPENVSIKAQPRDQPEPTDSKQGHMSNSSRREELLRELKAVEDAIARKRARIE